MSTPTVTTRRIGDDRLPVEHDWMALEVDGTVYALVKESAGTEAVREAQEAARRLQSA